MSQTTIAPAAEGTSQAAPGALLRATAETAAQDPSKINSSAQVGSPIRNLQANPIESTIPQGATRVLNVTPPANPNIDFNGLHSMLSSLPVPPPHIAAALIRAIMTPPGQSGVVAPNVTPSVGSSNPSPVAPSNAGGNGSVVTPSISAPSTLGGNRGGNNGGNAPSANFSPMNFSPAPQASPAPTTHQNVFGGNSFLGGTVGEGLGALGSLAKFVPNLLEEIVGRSAGFGASILPMNIFRNNPLFGNLFGGGGNSSTNL